MIKRLLLIVSFIFVIPETARAEVLFREGSKIWRDYSGPLYDTHLTSATVNFPDGLRVSKNRGVDLGPVAIRIDGFFDGDHPYLDYWVRVYPLPNIQLDNHISVKIAIDHVWDFENNDIYKREERVRQLIQNIAGDEVLTFINKLFLSPGTDIDEIQEIVGEVVFTLPLKLESIVFENAELKKEKTAAVTASKARLNNLRFNGESTWIEIRYEGKEETYLTTLAYDKTGNQLKKKGFAKNSVSGGWLYVYSFEGEVEMLKILLSSREIERKYPFKIEP